jgi:hypothetical protein
LIDLLNNEDEFNKLSKLLVSLSDLYSKALKLPQVEPENTEAANFDFHCRN